MRDEKGQYSTPDDKSISADLEELLGLYLDSLTGQKKGTADSTVTTRRREVRYWLAFCESNGIDPLAAETSDVRGYIQNNTNLADTTVGSYYRSVQSFYSVVENDEAHEQLVLTKGHPCPDKNTIDLKNDYRIYENQSEYKRQHSLSPRNIDGARSPSNDILALLPEQVEKLFENVPGSEQQTRLRNEIVVRLAWYTGCRSDELSRMKVENIDWDNCLVNVRSAKLNPEEHPDLIRRDVCFPAGFRFQLKRWCERVRHGFCGVADPDKGPILVTTHSDEMQPTQINNIIKSAARNADVQRPLRPADPEPNDEVQEWFVTSHRIRRSAITHWVNDVESLDLHQVRRLAGHARINQTMQYVEDDDEQLISDYQRGMDL